MKSFLRPFGINNLVAVPRTLRVDFDCELSTNHKTNARRRLWTSPFTASIKGLSAARVDRLSFLSYFFVKKIPLSRRVEYVMDGSMDESVSQ